MREIDPRGHRREPLADARQRLAGEVHLRNQRCDLQTGGAHPRLPIQARTDGGWLEGDQFQGILDFASGEVVVPEGPSKEFKGKRVAGFDLPEAHDNIQP